MAVCHLRLLFVIVIGELRAESMANGVVHSRRIGRGGREEIERQKLAELGETDRQTLLETSAGLWASWVQV